MELYRIKFESPTKVKHRNYNVEFENGFRIEDYHEQDCCEHVYADWSSLDNTGFDNLEISELVIEGVECVGFRINGYTVHCYNSQNGYYSSDLELNITYNGKLISINISDFVEDNIY